MEAAKRQRLSEPRGSVEGNNERESTAVSHVASDITNDQKLKDLLESWGVLSLFDKLHDCGINYGNLQLLEECDYSVLLNGDSKMLGYLITFRSLHREWKMNVFPSNAVVNVRLILEQRGESAEELTSFFENRGKLTHPMRVKLVDLILDEGHYLTRPMMSNIADQIVEIFPGELQRHYYEKLPGRQPTGLLFKRFNDLQLRKTESTSIEIPAEVVTNETVPNELTELARSSIDYLNDESNYGEDMNEKLIIEYWEATFPYRDYRTADDWLPLRKPFGDVLIHVDFKQKYGKTSADSLNGFDQFVARNEEYILGDIRNSLVRKEVERAFSEDDASARQRIIMMGLFHLSCMVPFKVSTKKKTWTPTIVESKNGFCVTVKRFAAIEVEVQKRKIFCENKGMKEHPMIFHTTDNEGYIVKYGSLLYQSKDGFIDAVDTAFKIFVMFDVPFPGDSSKIWHFFNEIFYKIDLKEQANAAFTSMLCSFEF